MDNSINKAELFIHHFMLGISSLQQSIPFIKEHKLWRGFGRYGWLSKILMVIGLIAGLKFLSLMGKWWSVVRVDDAVVMLQSVGTLFKDVALDGYGFLFIGAFKYLLLILMEILIFHFARRTLEIKTGTDHSADFKTFLKAEVRMIKVAIRCFIGELILSIMVSIGVGILGLDFLEMPLTLFIQCYFLGFVVIDNYHEIFGLTIRQSDKLTRRFSGVAISIGLATYLLLLIPLLGAVAAPLIVGVAGTLAMYQLIPDEQSFKTVVASIENDDLNKKSGTVE